MRNYLLEFIGTFFLVFVIGLTGNPLAIGAILMAMVYMAGHLSGAHYNPAVTLAIYMRKKISSKDMILYMLFQVLGAIAASAVFYFIFGNAFSPAPRTDMNILKPLLIETIFTFALVSVVLSVATSKKTAGNSYYGLAIGFTITAAAIAGGPISGGAYNPAVGIGPSLIHTACHTGTLNYVWIYIVGPFLGAIAATLVYNYVNPGEVRDDVQVK
jgi:aquaporin Z